MIIDSHTHIYHEVFNEDFDEMIIRARVLGVKHFLMPAIDSEYIDALHKLADRLPDHAHPMMGLHPCSVKENYQNDLIDSIKLVDVVVPTPTGVKLYGSRYFQIKGTGDEESLSRLHELVYLEAEQNLDLLNAN